MADVISKTGWVLSGFRYAFKTQLSIRQEIICLVVALPAAWFVAAGPWEMVALIAVLLLLLAVELLNSCVETICDHVTPETHPLIKVIKDMGAAAVFTVIILAALVWGCALLQRLGAF